MSTTAVTSALLLALLQPPAGPNADAHLAAWEAAGKGLNTFRADLTLTKTDAVFRKVRGYTGSVLLMKPASFALRLTDTSGKGEWEEYIISREK